MDQNHQPENTDCEMVKNKIVQDFLGGQVVKNQPSNSGDMSSIPGKWRWKSLSHVRLFVTPWTVAHQVGYWILVYGIIQTRILEWVGIFFCRGSSWPSDWTQVFPIAGRLFSNWATKEPRDLRSYMAWDS